MKLVSASRGSYIEEGLGGGIDLLLGRYAAVDHAAAMESYERPRLELE